MCPTRKVFALTLLAMIFASLAIPPHARGQPAKTQSIEEVDLRHLSAGSTLTLTRNLVIPANTQILTLTPPHSPLSCVLRMNRARPYTRVLREGRDLLVTGAERSAVSTKKWISISTRIQVQSESVDDILCSGTANQPAPKVRDFKEATHGTFSLAVPLNAIEVS